MSSSREDSGCFCFSSPVFSFPSPSLFAFLAFSCLPFSFLSLTNMYALGRGLRCISYMPGHVLKAGTSEESKTKLSCSRAQSGGGDR